MTRKEFEKRAGLNISISNDTEQENLERVKQDSRAIKYIENPSEEVKLEAVKQNPNAYKYFKNEWFK